MRKFLLIVVLLLLVITTVQLWVMKDPTSQERDLDHPTSTQS